MLADLVNCMFIHNYLSDEFMDSVIIPIVKDSNGDISANLEIIIDQLLLQLLHPRH